MRAYDEMRAHLDDAARERVNVKRDADALIVAEWDCLHSEKPALTLATRSLTKRAP
jgi:hypothetical protein